MKTNTKNRLLVCMKPSYSYCLTSPLGSVTVTACHDGIHSLQMDENLTDKNFIPCPNNKVKLTTTTNQSENVPLVVRECEDWLRIYFDNPHKTSQCSKPNICHLNASDKTFCTHVWQVLMDTVRAGEIVTYGDLAGRINNPGAVRAVGSAMRNNPTAIIVPCHRVVRSSGMGLYHGGKRQDVKKWLLNHEGVQGYK